MDIDISDFTGCKIALFCGDKLLTILRDDKDNIPWPNMWELPGGGREGDESPFECVSREVYEELGIHLNEDCLLWSKVYPSMLFEGRQSVFMVGQLSQEQFDNITFGDEGQTYKLMSIEEFLNSKQAVPQLQGRLRDYLEEVRYMPNRSKNINMFLIDGEVTGIIKCTLSNWTGVIYKIPRIQLADLKSRDEMKQSGIYFLFGRDEDKQKDVTYIGQATNRKNGEGVLLRIQEHTRDNHADYFNDVIILTTQNNSFGPTEISYLENKFTQLAKDAGASL